MRIAAVMITVAIAVTGCNEVEEAPQPTPPALETLTSAPPPLDGGANIPGDLEANEFATQAASSNRFEIESSEYASTRLQDTELRSFAERMIMDHQMASDQLSLALTDSGLNPQPIAPTDRHQELLDQLREIGDDAFDAGYANMQLQAHDEAVALFERYAQDGDVGPLQNFATNTLPTLQGHLDMIRPIAERVNETGNDAAAPN